LDGRAVVEVEVGSPVASNPETFNEIGSILDTPLVVIYIVDATVVVVVVVVSSVVVSCVVVVP
jgi:hypothetical protein